MYLQKKRTPEPSHSTRQLSTAISAAAFVAEYSARHGAGMVAATEERWCSAGEGDVEARRGICSMSFRFVAALFDPIPVLPYPIASYPIRVRRPTHSARSSCMHHGQRRLTKHPRANTVPT